MAKKRRNWLRLLRHNYDFDFGYLLDIEKEKLKDMLKYFKRSKWTNTEFIVRDITICIKLLNLYEKSNHKNVNTRNAKRFLSPPEIESLNDNRVISSMSEILDDFRPSDLARDTLYHEKVWHLYCLIREYRTRTWWD